MRGHDSSLNSHRWGHWGKIYHICHIMEPLSVLLGFKRDPPYLWSSRLWSIQVIGTDDCCWRDSQLQKTSIYLSIVKHLSKFLRRLWTYIIPKYVKKDANYRKQPLSSARCIPIITQAIVVEREGEIQRWPGITTAIWRMTLLTSGDTYQCF